MAAVIDIRSHHGILATTNSAFATAATGGTLAGNLTYYYRVTVIGPGGGETLASPETSQVVPAGTNTNTVTVNWAQRTGNAGYKVYGRTTGAEQLIATVATNVTTYLDTGAITPNGALPTANLADDAGTAVTGTSIRFQAADADGTGPTIARGAGAAFNYSWVKQLRLYVTGAPATLVSNLKWYFGGTLPTGITVGAKSSPTFIDVNAQAATLLAGTASVAGYTINAPLSLGGSSGTTGQLGDFVLLQLGATSTAASGVNSLGSYVFRYDEQ